MAREKIKRDWFKFGVRSEGNKVDVDISKNAKLKAAFEKHQKAVKAVVEAKKELEELARPALVKALGDKIDTDTQTIIFYYMFGASFAIADKDTVTSGGGKGKARLDLAV